MNIERKLYLGIIIGISVIMLNSFASAFNIGVSGNLNLYPGQELDAFYSLINTVSGNSAIVVEGQIEQGAEIVSFSDGNKFDVPADGIVSVPVRYSIPKDAPIGKVYTVSVMFKTLTAGQGSGSIGFAQDARSSLTVTVVAEPEKQNITLPVEESKVQANIWLGILVVVVVAVVLWWAIRKKAMNR